MVEAVRGAAWLVVLGAAAVGVLSLLAWALARSTIYTITRPRVVLRFGVALPMSVNLPLRLVESADLRAPSRTARQTCRSRSLPASGWVTC